MHLMPQPPYPWLYKQWHSCVERERQGQLPHALLITGQDGLGGGELALALAQFLLCLSPVRGVSCGDCRSCMLLKAQSHPDLFILSPEASSSTIKIQQIRELRERIANTAQQGGRKVIVMDPAEAMNVNAANALLKNLEEPPGNTLFLLTSLQPARLMPTIRSRCARLNIPIPPTSDAIAWLERNQVAGAGELLKAAGGAPLKVMRWLEEDKVSQRQVLEKELVSVLTDRGSAVEGAKTLASLDGLWVVDTLLSWTHSALTAPVLSEPAAEPVLSLAKIPELSLFRWYDMLLARKSLLLSPSNPNPLLLFEDLLLSLSAIKA